MEHEGPINFKALKAKFQEGPALAMNRPAIAQKPVRLPPPGSHCGNLVLSMHSAVENKTAVVPRVIFRDVAKGFLGKRPISFPPHDLHTSLPQQNDGFERETSKQSFRDRHMPLVLPGLPKDKKTDTDYLEGASHPIKFNKRDVVLPFKSTKVSNVVRDTGKDQVCAEPTTKTQGEVENTAVNGVSFQGDGSTKEKPTSSPDQTITPPFSDPDGDSEAAGTRFFNQRAPCSLEKVKKKFSPQQLFNTRSKSLRCNGVLPEMDSVEARKRSPEVKVPHPVCLPHISIVAARPFSKTNGYTHSKMGQEATFKRQFCQDPLKLHEAPPQPPRKPLPALATAEYLPVKPPRPPLVDLSQYQLSMAVDKEIAPEVELVALYKPELKESSIIKLDLPAPDFPDFRENSEVENIEDRTHGRTSLKFEDHGNPEIPAPVDFGNVGSEELPVCEALELPSSDLQALSLNNYNLMCPDPPILPETPVLQDTEILPEPLLLPHSPVPEVKVENEAFPLPVLEPEMVRVELLSDEPTAAESLEHVSTGQVQPQPSVCQQDNYYEACNNVYEDVENINKFITGQNSRKRRGSPKNPYAVSHPEKEDLRTNLRPRNARSSLPKQHSFSNAHVRSKERHSPENHDDKDQKKKEKHRLEKEKKEQKEKEKKENEMKKKFKITGKEEPLYHAKVMVANKVRKNDLLVKSGETVSIIRTTNCPKGKWLARDNNHKYGYISVMNVELNIKEMLELGKKARAEGDNISIESRSFHLHPLHTSSFTDDSEEWTCEDETMSLSNTDSCAHNQTVPMPEMLSAHASAHHTVSDAILEDPYTQHQALQKLAIFFQHKTGDFSDLVEDEQPTSSEFSRKRSKDQEVDFSVGVELLPPPELYADTL